MAEYRGSGTPAIGTTDTSIDQGLRTYMLGVYNLMAGGLGITGLAAWALYALSTTTVETGFPVGNGLFLTEIGQTAYLSPLKWVLMLAPLAMVFFLSFRIDRLTASGARSTFFLFTVLMGLSLSTVFLAYTSESITQVFFLTAASFGALSLYGYTTKTDLTGMGTFLFMGLIGLILAMVVNLFLGSSALGFAISVVGVLVFAGLTAYDTQKIKEMYYEGDGGDAVGRKSVMGALTLYLDFVNMFLFLLRLVGIKVND